MTIRSGQVDIAELKRAAFGRWREILVRFGFDHAILDGRHHACPKSGCGGEDRFRLVDEAHGACLCNQCFNNRNGDGIAATSWLNDWTFNETVHNIASFLGISDSSPRPFEDIVKKMARLKRIPLQAFIDFGAHEAIHGKMTVARIPMFDPMGKQCSYCDFSDFTEGFLKGMTASKCAETPGVGLYYAQRPVPGMTVLITEGPKDAAALHSLGFSAVGLPTSKMAIKFARVFAGCHVVVIPDLDETGDAAAPVTAARLHGIAASVRIARLPGEMKTKDGDGVREVLARADGETLLRQAIEDARTWQPKVAKGLLAEEGSEWTSLTFDQGRTDRANSRRFLASYREQVRFCFAWGKWLVWDGTRWQIDSGGAVMRMAMAIADQVWMDAKGNLTKEIVNFAVKTSGHGSLKAMQNLAAADVPVSVADLDANPWLLNCPNGTVDLRSGTLKPHRREDNLTNRCPTDFNPDASSYNWDRFLEGLFGDSSVIEYLQRFFGYCLTGDVSEQLLSVLYGVGSNGKSTLLNAVQRTLGDDYTAAAPPSLLMEKKSEAHPTELAGLFGKRLVVAQETSAGARLDEATVKKLTGSDIISARRMREDFWSFYPTHKLMMATNHKPRIQGTDHAIWRRVVLIPFERRFWNPAKGEDGPDELRQDKDLPEKLAAESEGILAWMIQGCVAWQRGGLQIPASIQAATEAYRSEENSLGRFISERCLTGIVYKVKFADLYDALENWCSDNGDNPPNRKVFGQYLKDQGYKDRSSNGRWYEGIALSNEAPDLERLETLERSFV